MPGQNTAGGVVWADRDRAFGALRAIDATTGELRVGIPLSDADAGRRHEHGLAGSCSRATTRATSSPSTSATGEKLWHYQTGTSIWGAAAMTYMLDGRQHVLIPAGGNAHGLCAA